MLGFFTLAFGAIFVGSFFTSQDNDQEIDTSENDESLSEHGHENALDLMASTTVLIDGNSGSFFGDNADDHVVLDAPNNLVGSMGFANINGAAAEFIPNDGEFYHIDLGAGDDLLEVLNGTANIVTGDGADTVDASGMLAGAISAGAGDIVYGSDVITENDGQYSTGTLAVTAHGAQFFGGNANEVAVATGEGAILHGGGGNDQLAAFEGDAELHGGAGNDWLIGNATGEHFDQSSRFSNISYVTNESFDTLNGGDGNDRLLLSNGDVGVGGEGADSFEIYHSTAHPQIAAHILDFSPSEDALVVYIEGGEPDAPEDLSYDLRERVTLSEFESGTEIVVDGSVVATIDGVTQMRVGIPAIGSDRAENDLTGMYVDAVTGTLAHSDEFDVLVRVYEARSS